MPWTKPDFQEISLNMEVTAYVNTDASPRLTEPATPKANAADGSTASLSPQR